LVTKRINFLSFSAFSLCVALALTPGAVADSAKDLLAAGRIDDAIGTLQARLNTKSDDAQAYNLLCRAYFTLDDWDHGIAACEKAVSLDPNTGVYHLWLARIYGEKADSVNFLSAAGMAGKIRKEFERAVACDPDSAEARTDLAEFYLEAPRIVGGGKDKARAQIGPLAKLNPAMAHWVSGRIAEKNKETATAEREYRAAIDASHGGARAWLDLALFYRHVARFDDMVTALQHVASAPVDYPEALTDGANTLLRTNRDYPLAMQLVRRYLSSTPVETSPVFKAHYLLGQLLEKQGDKEAAAQEYRAALALAHEFKRAQEALDRVSR